MFNEGDVLVPKIANVKLLADPSIRRRRWRRSAEGKKLVVIGAEKDGYINVQGADGSGWVKIVLMQKR